MGGNKRGKRNASQQCGMPRQGIREVAELAAAQYQGAKRPGLCCAGSESFQSTMGHAFLAGTVWWGWGLLKDASRCSLEQPSAAGEVLS